MGSSKTYLRLLSFAGVLILSGALMLGLFQGAQAADMNFVQTDDSPSGTTDYSFEIVIPDGQAVPIENVGAVVERNNPDFNGKRGAFTTAHAQCPMDPLDGMDCTPDGTHPDRLEIDGQSGVITRIQLDRIYEQGADRDLESGYTITCTDSDTCYFETSGYGYDGSLDHLGDGYSSDQWKDTGIGYGYGYDTGRAEANVGNGYTGYGYNQAGEGDLVIQFTVTIDADQLEEGTTYWISGITDTGTDIVGAFTTRDFQFSPDDGGGGPPAGGGGGGGVTGARTVDLGVSFDIEADEWIQVEDLPDGYDMLRLKFAQACDGCTVRMEVHGNSPPSGTAAAENGWRAFEYFSIWIEDEDGNELDGYIDEATLEFDVDADELDDEDPGQVVLLHDDTWTPEDTRHTNDAGDDPLEYNATIGGFSVFAQAVDTEEPTITNTQPTGDIRQVSPSLTADFEDNRGIDADSFELTIDGETADDTTGTLSVSEDGFTYTPGTALEETQHTVEATVSDTSGLSTTETWTFTIEEGAAQCPELAQLTDPQPPDGATDVTFEDEISISVAEGSCALVSGELVVNGETVATEITDGALSADIPDSVEAGEQVNVTATVTDDGGNDQAREWSFTMSEDAGEEDGGALVWVIVALVVLAIIGVGAYFYTQQGGGGT